MKKSKYFLFCLFMIATQNNTYSMDKPSNINPKRILGTIAAVLVTTDLWIISQNNQMKSPIESSLHMIPYPQAQVIETYVSTGTLNNKNQQGFYYLRGSAPNCDDQCTC